MTPQKTALQRLLVQEDLNFLLTNRIPRITLTHLMGWFSKIRSPWLTRLSIAVWRFFTPLDLSDAQTTRFNSLHECFTRTLKPGARPFDPRQELLCSPSDGIVGACGPVAGVEVFQAKGFPYSLVELLGSAASADHHRDGVYVTLRLTSAMYHRFHAPSDLQVREVNYISGDTWNVNPIALKRVERLFCRNERVVIHTTTGVDTAPITLVAVAAVLVASVRLHFLDVLLHLRYRGPHTIPCDARLQRGQEMGWFEHGSTIIVLAPKGFRLADAVMEGAPLRAGQALLVRDHGNS
ncbi:MAG: hypothetical protein RIR09_2156 [Pseudomonadota bacterium]|jgi:phosphatidylserine decarboxylase